MDESSGKSGYEAIEEYGWGDKDPITGIYEGYDLPPQLARRAGNAVTWPALLANWSLVVFTFHTALGVDLEDVWRVKSWRWFSARVRHLLSTDTPLSRFFAPDDTATEVPRE